MKTLKSLQEQLVGLNPKGHGHYVARFTTKYGMAVGTITNMAVVDRIKNQELKTRALCGSGWTLKQALQHCRSRAVVVKHT